MAGTGTTIAIRPSEQAEPRRIIKIIPYTSGGFGVTVPYHSAQDGFLAKMPIDYKRMGVFPVSRADMTRYSAADRVKLSYHPDGFAQFSGEQAGKIVSGRDVATGEPKGLGLLTSPLSRPISSGPSFGVTIWGIQDFQPLVSGKSAEIFDGGDSYFRGCSAETANGWIVEAFVFPRRFWNGVRMRQGRNVLMLAFDNFEATRAVFELRVVDLPGQGVFLGLILSRVHVSFASNSGFVLSGPGCRLPDGTGSVLMAVYPAHAGGGIEDAAPLDYGQSPRP